MTGVLSEHCDRIDVFNAICSCGSRKVEDVAAELINSTPALTKVVRGSPHVVFASVLAAAKRYCASVLKSLSMKDLDYIHQNGGPVYCLPSEWLNGPVDVMMNDYPELHCKSNIVPSLGIYLTSYELMEHPRYRAEMQVVLQDHATSVNNVNSLYNKAASRDWRGIIKQHQKQST